MTRAEGSAAIPNWMFRDLSLSIHAVMVYGSLASRAGLGGIYPSRQTIAKEARCSVRKVADALNELEVAGAVERVKRRTKTGQASSGYRLIPGGHLRDDESGNVEAQYASTPDQRARGAQGEGTSEQIAPPIEVTNQEVEVLTLTFDDFWSVWPKKNAKKDAERAWEKAVKKVSPDVIIAAARTLAESPYRPELKFIPYGASWLNGERWNDPAPDPSNTPRTFAQQKQDGNLALLARYRTTTTEGQDDGQVTGSSAAGVRALSAGPGGH